MGPAREAWVEMAEWRELVAAEREVARLRAEVNRLPVRTELLVEALSGSSTWDRVVAMTFLRMFPEDVPALLDLLVDYSLSHGWAQPAWEAIRAARRDITSTQLAEVVMRNVQDADAEDYLRLADMLTHVGDRETLSKLTEQGRLSGDPDIREVARDFAENFGGMAQVWWGMRCEQNHAWWRYRSAASEPSQDELTCPVDGAEAVTAGKFELADRVVLELIPAAWDGEGVIGFEDQYFVEISSRDGARSLRSARVFSFDEACRRLSWFKGLTWADAARRWERTGMRTPDALKTDSPAPEGG